MKHSRLFSIAFILMSCGASAVPIIDSASPNSNLPTGGGTAITVTGGGFVVPVARSFTQIAAGSYHTCAIGVDDERAYCWGSNSHGELGDGTFADSFVPIAVDTSGVLAGLAVKQISTSDSHTCVIASDDHAYCWGRNDTGQLGNGSFVNSFVPVAVDTSGVLAGKAIRQIAAGSFHTCVVAVGDMQIYCWGNNSFGSLGNGSLNSSSTPVAVNVSGVLEGLTIQQVAAGNAHTCVIASDGGAYCWGGNFYGQLGNATNGGPDICLGGACSMLPVAVDTTGVLAGLTIRQIATSYFHTCAIASDGQAYCWGISAAGQLGNNDSTGPNSCIGHPCSVAPVAVIGSGALAGMAIEQISAGSAHTCALASNGQSYCWGWSILGLLGNGNSKGPDICDGQPCSMVPVAVDTSGVLAGLNIQQITAGSLHTCAAASNGQAYCWGFNGYGELGNPSVDYFNPVAIGVANWLLPTVLVGDAPVATGVRVASDTTLTFTAPPNAAGTYDLAIDYGAAMAQLSNALTYFDDIIFGSGFEQP